MSYTDLPEESTQLIAQSVSLTIEDRLDDALACLEKLLLIQPDFFPALFHKGEMLSQLSRFEEAALTFEQLLTYRPDLKEAVTLRQDALISALDEYDQAIVWAQGDIHQKQRVPAELYFKRGNILLKLGHYTEAISSLTQCLSIEKTHLSALNGLGNALLEIGLIEEALVSYEQLLLISPDNTAAMFNRANVLQKLGRFHEALESYQIIVKYTPYFPEAMMEQSHCRLMLGDFETGWQQYEWRWKTQQLKPHIFNSPAILWQGQFSLHDKSILLWAEQGFGDTIQFVRYVQLVKDIAKRTILRVPTVLHPLMRSLGSNISVINETDPVPEHNTHCPLLTLPMAFQTNLTNIPANTPYLHANHLQISKWAHKLGINTRLRVGIVWAGRQYGLKNHTRDVHLDDLSGLTKLNIDLIGLQKEIPDADRAILSKMPKSMSAGECLGDFSDTAALIANLDLIISVDSAVAHLAGAMGKPVWLLLRRSGEWRWLENRSDSPWYPAHKIFRQKHPGHWNDVVQAIIQELEKITY
jgi:tetratricopeptide (TPR) repeat protein